MKSHCMYLVTKLLSLLLLAQGILSLEINNARDLVSFSNKVSKGKTFAGETVYLTDDIDLLTIDSFQPIGIGDEYTDIYKPFLGTFDGKGYTIKNLNITTSNHFVGLIGIMGDYDRNIGGGVVDNVVLDSSCTIESRCTGEHCYGYEGGIVGFCLAQDSNCIIRNSVNMATVKSHGNAQMIGGIIGHCFVEGSYSCTVDNCINYGKVAFNSTDVVNIEDWSFFAGGIAGFCGGSKSGKCSIQSSANYGSIEANINITRNINIGGILSFGNDNVHIWNCVNMGHINTGFVTDSHIGTLVGFIEFEEVSSSIAYSYWRYISLDINNACGNCDPLYVEINNVSSIDMNNYTLNNPILINNKTVEALIPALNTMSTNPGWGYATLYCDDCLGLESFKDAMVKDYEDPAIGDSSLALHGSFPRPSKGVFKFLGWHLDENFTEKVDDMKFSDVFSGENATVFYARFGSNVVKLVARYPKEGKLYKAVLDEIATFTSCPFKYLSYEAGGIESDSDSSESVSRSGSGSGSDNGPNSASSSDSSASSNTNGGKQTRDVVSSSSGSKNSKSESSMKSSGSSSGTVIVVGDQSSSSIKEEKKHVETLLFTGIIQFYASEGIDEYTCASDFVSTIESKTTFNVISEIKSVELVSDNEDIYVSGVSRNQVSMIVLTIIALLINLLF